MDEYRFDNFSRALATGASRRGAIGLLLGGVVAAFGRGRPSAAKGSDCAALCLESLPPGRERGQCIATCQRGQGPFAACQGDLSRICINPGQPIACCGADEICTAVGCACPDGTERCGGACVEVCPPEKQRDVNTCACVCPTVACDPPRTVINLDTCACECPGCGPPRTSLDPDTCACGCPPTTCSPPREAVDPATCACTCPSDPTCLLPKQINLDTCECACSLSTCEAPTTELNPDTCACECPAGADLCNGGCFDACPEGQERDPDTCACSNGGDGCICDLTPHGEPCTSQDECCTGYCSFFAGGVCDLSETGCAFTGTFCSNDATGDNYCCSGLCEDCNCVCRPIGDTTCTEDRECCDETVCSPVGCCEGPGQSCVLNSDCCSGLCEDLDGDGDTRCACAAVGTPCSNGSQCCSEVCGPDSTCACSTPQDSSLQCRYENDCCGGKCLHGTFSGHGGVDGFCCRFTGEYCKFGYECCSENCNSMTNECV